MKEEWKRIQLNTKRNSDDLCVKLCKRNANEMNLVHQCISWLFVAAAYNLTNIKDILNFQSLFNLIFHAYTTKSN